jgi:hypothetical protein
MTGMTADNVLLGIIIAGIGLCGAYFWAEIARRQRDWARSQKRQRTLNEIAIQAATLAEVPADLRDAANGDEVRDGDAAANREEAANDGAPPTAGPRTAHSRRD